MPARLGIILGLLLLLLSPSLVFARGYVFEKGNNNTYTNAHKILNPQNSQDIYGLVSAGESVIDYYLLEPSELQSLTIELLVPQGKASELQPNLILADTESQRVFGQVPYGYPPHLGARVYSWSEGSGEVVEDKAMLNKFTTGPAIVRDFSSRPYYLGVYDPQSKGGRYVLRINGVEKSAGIGGFFARIIAFIRIKLGLY